jgi:hypothetical protein
MEAAPLNPLTAARLLIERVRSFRLLSASLLGLMRRSSQLAAAAKGTPREAHARRVAAHMRQLWSDYQDARGRFDSIVSKVPGLGVAPAVLIAIAGGSALVALAGAMSSIFRRATAAERLIALVERGDVSTAEAAQLEDVLKAGAGSGGLFSGLHDMAKWVALAVVASIVIPALKQARAR